MAFVILLFVVEGALLASYIAARRQSVTKPRWWLHEVMLAWQTAYWVGAGALLFATPSAETVRFVAIASVTQLSFTTGCLIAISIRVTPAEPAAELTAMERRLVIAVAAVSALVCFAFIAVVVRNEDLRLILASVLTGEEDFLSYRLIMSTGRAIYLAPGYVKQFRDVLLTASLVMLVARTRKPSWGPLAAVALLGFIAAILSGERSVLMIYVYTFGLAFLLRPGRSVHGRRIALWATAGVAVAAFVGATIILGRTTVGASPLTAVFESVWGLFDRMVLTVPRENAAGFPVWGAIAPTWGQTWMADIAGIIPGAQESLSNELHALLGGSPLGNSTLGLASDVYLAWGMIGVVVVPMAYALMLAAFDRMLLRSSSAIARTFRFVCIPLTFAWYSPFLFILNGGVVMIAVAVFARFRSRRG